MMTPREKRLERMAREAERGEAKTALREAVKAAALARRRERELKIREGIDR